MAVVKRSGYTESQRFAECKVCGRVVGFTKEDVLKAHGPHQKRCKGSGDPDAIGRPWIMCTGCSGVGLVPGE